MQRLSYMTETSGWPIGIFTYINYNYISETKNNNLGLKGNQYTENPQNPYNSLNRHFWTKKKTLSVASRPSSCLLWRPKVPASAEIPNIVIGRE